MNIFFYKYVIPSEFSDATARMEVGGMVEVGEAGFRHCEGDSPKQSSLSHPVRDESLGRKCMEQSLLHPVKDASLMGCKVLWR